MGGPTQGTAGASESPLSHLRMAVKGKGLGYMKESMVRKSVATANKHFKLSPQVDYKKVYTNQFIRPNPGM